MTLRPPRTDDFREIEAFKRRQESLVDSKGDSAGIRASVADSKGISAGIRASVADSKAVQATVFGDIQYRNGVTRIGQGFNNYLSNSNFEYWFAGISGFAPTSWYIYGSIGCERSSVASNGNYSAQLTFNANDDQMGFQLPAFPNTKFAVCLFYQKLSGVGNNVATVLMEGGADYTEYGSVALDPTIDGQWKFTALSVAKPNDGTNSMILKFASRDGNQSVWLFDEVVLQEGLNSVGAWVPNWIDDQSYQWIYAKKKFWSGIEVNEEILLDGLNISSVTSVAGSKGESGSTRGSVADSKAESAGTQGSSAVSSVSSNVSIAQATGSQASSMASSVSVNTSTAQTTGSQASSMASSNSLLISNHESRLLLHGI